MNHRERFQAALNHQEADRVPLDIGGSIVTSIALDAYQKLIKPLGLPEREVQLDNLYSQTARMDDDVCEALGVDACGLRLSDPTGYALHVYERDGFQCFTDEWQIDYAMPLDGQSGYSVVKHPLEQAATVQEIEAFAWPDGADAARFSGFEEQVRFLAEEKQMGIILETNIGGIYEWPAWLRRTENFLMDLGDNEAMAIAVMERICQFKIEFWEAALSRVGNYVDLVRESDDLAGQNGLLISKEMYRRMIKPYHRRICETIRKHTNATICLHSCGGVWDLIPDLIDAGFTGLNPIQVGTAKMDPVAIKREFGKNLVLWGAACDSQYLPKLTPNQVKEQTRKNLEALAPGGGFIYSPINMIQADVPPENILAMVETLHEYGSY